MFGPADFGRHGFVLMMIEKAFVLSCTLVLFPSQRPFIASCNVDYTPPQLMRCNVAFLELIYIGLIIERRKVKVDKTFTFI